MTPVRQVVRLILLGLVLLGLPAVVRAATTTVEIDAMAYGPRDVTIAAGGSVRWVNNDSAPHNAVARDESWRTPILQTGQEATVTFETAGSFQYFCSLHPGMVATVVVASAELPSTDTADSTAADGVPGSSVSGLLAASLAGLLVLGVALGQRLSRR